MKPCTPLGVGISPRAFMILMPAGCSASREMMAQPELACTVEGNPLFDSSKGSMRSYSFARPYTLKSPFCVTSCVCSDLDPRNLAGTGFASRKGASPYATAVVCTSLDRFVLFCNPIRDMFKLIPYFIECCSRKSNCSLVVAVLRMFGPITRETEGGVSLSQRR